MASRFGRVRLRRQVLAAEAGGSGAHVTPGPALLPPHGGIVITRGLQEVACLLADTLPFASVERLLGWQTHPEAEAEADVVLCASTVRTLVREHGAAVAQAEQAEVARLTAALADGGRAAQALRPRLRPAQAPRRRVGWPAELGAAVDQALAAGETRPPCGVRAADWARVLAARQLENDERTDLRRLGPEVRPTEVVVSADAVLTRRPQRRQFWELRTARVATTEGYRYVSGTGVSFLATLGVLSTLCHQTGAGPSARAVVLLADGARWLRDFDQDRTPWPRAARR